MIWAGFSGQGGSVYAGLLPTPSPLPSVHVALPTVSPPVTIPPGVISSPQPPPAPVLLPQPSGAAPSGSGSSGTSAGGGSGNGSSHHGADQHSSSGSSGSSGNETPAEKQNQSHFQSDYRDDEEWEHDGQVQQQQDQYVLSQLPGLESKYNQLALSAGGGKGQFGLPELVNPKHPTPISQGFGCSELLLEPYDAACSTKHFHTGIDIVGPFDTPVFAPDDGVAVVFDGISGYGNYIVITHGHGYQTLFGHLEKTLVNTGDVVHRGDVIGLEGSTGYSTGPHLHFEIRYKSAFVDPCSQLDCSGHGRDVTALLAAKVAAAAAKAAASQGAPEAPEPERTKGPW